MAQTVFGMSSYFINSATARASHSLTSLTTARCREPEVSVASGTAVPVFWPPTAHATSLEETPSLLMCPCSPCYLHSPLPSPAPSALACVCPNPHPHLWSLPKVLPDCFLHVSFPIPKSIRVKMIKEPQMSYSENHLLF